MILSYSSFIATLIQCLLILLLLQLLLNFEAKRIGITPQFLYITGILFFVRLILPVEFGISITIPSSKVLPIIFDTLNFHLFTINNFTITVGNLLISIFLVGTALKLILFVRKTIVLAYYIRSQNIIQQGVKALNNKEYTVSYIKTSQVSSPSVYGIKSPIIFFPNNMNFTEKEFNYITLHELTHYQKGDTLFLFLFDLLTCFYWWNPLVYIFKKQMNKIIELRVDNELLKVFYPAQCIEYVECLLKVKKIQIQSDKENFLKANLINKNESTFELRSKKILSFNPIKATNRLLLISIMALSLGSMFFILEPYYSDPHLESTTFELNEKDDAFFIKHKDKTFSLFINGENKGTLNKIDEFPGGDSLPIYNEEETN